MCAGLRRADAFVHLLTQIFSSMCDQGREKGISSSFKPSEALCCSHGLLRGCPEVPLWLQGGCFVVVNWAGPGRAGVILGKACFPPLSYSVRLSSLTLLLCIDISDLPREEKVWCLLLVKRERQHCPFLLSVSQWASCFGVCVCFFYQPSRSY